MRRSLIRSETSEREHNIVTAIIIIIMIIIISRT
jgi:hypothetical protein